MTVTHLPRKRRNARVPLRIGDVWVLIGPKTEVRIAVLAARPTFQKPHAQAVTLSDGRTLAEATLRSSYMRKHEYENVFLPASRARVRAAIAEAFGESAKVIPFPRAAA